MRRTESGVVTLTAVEVRLVLYAVRDLVARADLGIRPPLSPGFGALRDRLVSSVRGTKSCASQAQSQPSAAEELIDSNEAAAILRCSDRWIRTIRDELHGQKIGGRCVFRRQTVVDYAERKAGQHK